MAGNAIRMTTTTAGTGDQTVAAVANFPTANDEFGLNRRFPYAILKDSDGTPFEFGIGYLSTATNFVREKILSTYVSPTWDDTSPTAVNLPAGTYRIICAPISEMVMEAAKNVIRNASLNLQKVVYSEHMTINTASSTGYTMTANRLVLVPFKLGCRLECDALTIRVGTGAASSNVRLGVWEALPDNNVGKLLGETASLASATSGADVIGTLTGGPITLTPGWYFTGVVSDGTPSVGRMSGGGECFNFLGPTPGNLMQAVGAFFGTYAFAALPNPGPTASLTAINSGSPYPAVGLRGV